MAGNILLSKDEKQIRLNFRQGSRSSLGELVTRPMTDSMFTMDDVNDAEGETDEEEELGDSPTVRDSSLARTLSFPLPSTTSAEQKTLLGSSAPARHRIDDQLLHPVLRQRHGTSAIGVRHRLCSDGEAVLGVGVGVHH